MPTRKQKIDGIHYRELQIRKGAVISKLAGDPVREEDAARFIHAIDALLTDDDANLVKLLGLNKKRISVAEENRLFIRASLISKFYRDDFASIRPYPASFEIADNLALLARNRSDTKIDDKYKRLFDALVMRGCPLPSQKVVREFLPKGAL